MDDSTTLHAELRAGARVVVVGFGFIGAEVAASARMLGCDVTIVEVFDVPLVRALGPEVGAHVGRLHADNGVRAILGVTVERFEGGARVERVVLSDGRSIDADVVVVGVGISANDELAREAGIACDNGIVVDEHCMTSVRSIFAAGDVASHPNPILGERIRIEHWQNAQNHGAAAARAILGDTAPFAEVPWFWSDQFDVNIQMAGHPMRWDRIVWRGNPDERNFAAYYRDGARIMAVVGFNRGKDVRASRALIQAGADVPDDVLADEATDLRALAKAYTSAT
jgi:3-phenylpropionate/trans-cinnamate dioxygenase ferredoxin reductase subunit